MDILFVSIASKNIHKQLASWCLKAYCDANLDGVESSVYECSINDNILSIVGDICYKSPEYIAISCYIWNVEYVIKITKVIKELLPKSKIILGGPELSSDKDERFEYADYIIKGAGEVAIVQLIRDADKKEYKRIIEGGSFDLKDSCCCYTPEFFESFSQGKIGSIENQLVYIETARGCPFACAYCLSSAEKNFSLLEIELVKAQLDMLVAKGAKCIKFVDRTFNAQKAHAISIWEHILQMETDTVFHFEVAADLFDDEMFALLAQMPDGRVQFETGVQSTNTLTLQGVNRSTDVTKVLSSIKRMAALGNSQVHCDLIAGMPHETFETMMAGVNEVLNMHPHVLQLGFLKLLHGTELQKNAASFGCVTATFPPYEVLKTDTMSVADLMKLRDIANLLDVFWNSGFFRNMIEYARELCGDYAKMLIEFANYSKGEPLQRSMRHKYALFQDFLLSVGADEKKLEDIVKMDCLSCDSKGALPENITVRRDKQAEAELKRQYPHTPVRVERLNNGKTMTVIYEKRHRVTKQWWSRETIGLCHSPQVVQTPKS